MIYGTWFSDLATETMLALLDYAYLRISDAVGLLTTQPKKGREYDPTYDAARPPIPVRVLYVGNHGIYYTPDHERSLIRVHFIEDQRRDPKLRLSSSLRERES